MATTDEKTKTAIKRIVNMIEVYGKERFALGMIYYYGLRSLIDRNELDDLQDVINDLVKKKL